MRRRNPFDVVVRLRGIREDEARRRLGRANASAARAREELEARVRARADRPAPPPSLTALELRALQIDGMLAEERVAEAEGTLGEADARAAEARDAWTEAVRDLRIAERLDATRRERLHRDAQRAAERAMDALWLTARAAEEADR